MTVGVRLDLVVEDKEKLVSMNKIYSVTEKLDLSVTHKVIKQNEKPTCIKIFN